MLVDPSGRAISSADLWQRQAEKAVVGPGANVYANGISIAGMTPAKYMEAAQSLYWRQPWIRTAEGIISRKLSTMDWHLAFHKETDALETPILSGPAYDFLSLGSPRQQLSRTKLWGITIRHMGVCNNAFWYPDLRRPENGCIYINPSRVTPIPTEEGYLSHWKVDANPWDAENSGVRFEKDEILWFQLEAADIGFYAHGLVYTAYTKAMLSQSADNHALQTLDSGGRLQGILTPKDDDYLNDFQFASVQRELRNITEMDDSAKRMVLLRKAVEFTPTTMRPGELELPTLMRMTKEDIYEIWGVPRSQTGGMTEVGMNSGDRQSYEEAALQQNAIHPRAVVFEETVNQLLKTFDPRLELEFDEPQFDDERPLFEMLKMSEFAPLSRNERRAIIKKPPIKGADGDIIEQNPGLLQVVPPLPIARSYITGRLQDGTTVDQPNTPQDPQQRLDAINEARGFRGKQDINKAELSEAIATRIIEKADHFLARPNDLDLIASQKLVAGVVGDKATAASILREVHDGLKAIIQTGRANDWAVEEYAEAVRGSALVSGHLEHAAPVMSASPPPRLTARKSDDGQVLVTLPKVNVDVPETIVNVPAPDMTPVAKAINDLGWNLLQAMPQPVNVPPPPVPEKLRRVVERDKDGRITAIVDMAV